MLANENGEKLLSNFIIDGVPMQRRNSTKWLGVQMDNKLDEKVIYLKYIFKVVRMTGYINHAREFLPRETLNMFYLGLIEPYFRYCCSVWDSCGTVIRQTTEKLQNRAIRTITYSLMKQSKLPCVQDMIQQVTVGIAYKAINNQVPEYLSILFNRVFTMTSKTLRNVSLNLIPP